MLDMYRIETDGRRSNYMWRRGLKSVLSEKFHILVFYVNLREDAFSFKMTPELLL